LTELILTLNAGSSSIKFAVFEAGTPPQERLHGQVEGIGTTPRLKAKAGAQTIADKAVPQVARHADALAAILDLVEQAAPGAEVPVVGHRIVHGGPRYAEPVVIDPEVQGYLETLIAFAPLHQPHNLAGVAAAHEAFPQARQLACFDTAFHRGQPWVSDTFALPAEYFEKGVRRYGFHGLSYDYVAAELARIAPEAAAGRVVIAHLGNGASMCALRAGKSVDSTMGFTALDGLAMGTRCGQIDPGVLLYLMDQEGLSPGEVSDLLYTRSGLLGLSGLSNDMRTLETAGTAEAEGAIRYFVHRIRRELGALTAVLGGLDALVFTGGIGENSVAIRAQACEGMGWLGLEIDGEANAAGAEVVSAPGSAAQIRVIATNEEMTIARAAMALLGR